MDKEYTQRINKIEEELNRWLPMKQQEPEASWAQGIFPGVGSKVSAPLLKSLFEPLGDILSRGGKRWRPLLMTLVCETLGGGEAALALTPLVEFCHNASLIHDDIEDDSDERRGKPAIHKIYGVDTAINAGSFFYFLPLCCIDSYPGDNKERIYSLWGEYMRKLHLGQAMDISWHRDINIIPEINEYYIMCGLKTGSLARLAVELGVFAAGPWAEAALQLGEAAEKLGIGFQILDDVKNLTTGIPGKKCRDDIIEGKKSLPILLYMHKYPEKQIQVFSCFKNAKVNGANIPEVDNLVKDLTETGIFIEAEEKAKSLINEARDIFSLSNYSGIPASKEGIMLLNGLIDLIS
jgi:octaprenyl-diphosphate synthase